MNITMGQYSDLEDFLVDLIDDKTIIRFYYPETEETIGGMMHQEIIVGYVMLGERDALVQIISAEEVETVDDIEDEAFGFSTIVRFSDLIKDNEMTIVASDQFDYDEDIDIDEEEDEDEDEFEDEDDDEFDYPEDEEDEDEDDFRHFFDETTYNEKAETIYRGFKNALETIEEITAKEVIERPAMYMQYIYSAFSDAGVKI